MLPLALRFSMKSCRDRRFRSISSAASYTVDGLVIVPLDCPLDANLSSLRNMLATERFFVLPVLKEGLAGVCCLDSTSLGSINACKDIP